jgi:hypothetical protein
VERPVFSPKLFCRIARHPEKFLVSHTCLMIPGKMELYTKPRDNAGLPAYAPGARPERICSRAIGMPQAPRGGEQNPRYYGGLQAKKP